MFFLTGLSSKCRWLGWLSNDCPFAKSMLFDGDAASEFPIIWSCRVGRGAGRGVGTGAFVKSSLSSVTDELLVVDVARILIGFGGGSLNESESDIILWSEEDGRGKEEEKEWL